jgi:hypothetical protein
MDEDDDFAFPSYEASGLPAKPVRMSLSSQKHPSPLSAPAIGTATHLYKTPQDDQALLPEPTTHVDYLSHEWTEEDIWLSWSYVLHRRGTLANHVRLENALWRSWLKTKDHLKTMPPESLNWFKDYDVTWLYGPRRTEGQMVQCMSNTSPQLTCLSDSASSIPNKSILKKNPSFICPHISTRPECKHVQFDKDIRQMQEVYSEDDDKMDEDGEDGDDEDDEYVLTMSPSVLSTFGCNRATPHASFSNEAKTIAPLPSATLKYRTDTDTPEPQGTACDQACWTGERSRSPSLPQAGSRPLGSSHNFLIDDNFDEVDELCQGENTSNDKRAHCAEEDSEYVPVPRMGWTKSSMFKQYIDDKEEDTVNNTLFGQAMYAVNTFKDIAYVVLNVGWNRT